MKTFLSAAFLGALASLSIAVSHGATWSDIQNRTWEGDFVRLQGVNAIFLVGGKEYPFPSANLSPASRAAIQAMLAPKAPTPAAAPVAQPAKEPRFGDVLLVPGKTVNGELPLDDSWKKAFVKTAGQEISSIKFAVAVPSDFDPAKPQKVLFTSASSSGNGLSIPNMNSYVKAANAKGWIVMSADSPLGKPKNDNVIFRQNLLTLLTNELNNKFPKAGKTWRVATAGFSGGAGYASNQALLLCKFEWKVSGMLLMNNSYQPVQWESAVKPPKTVAHKIPVFFSSGETDNVAKPDSVKDALKITERGGYKTTRIAWHPGGHNVEEEHISQALAWFDELAGGK